MPALPVGVMPVAALIKVVVLLSEALLAVDPTVVLKGVLIDAAPAAYPEVVPAVRAIKAAPLPAEKLPTVLLVCEVAVPAAAPPMVPLR